MKKRILKSIALFSAMALLVLPGISFSFRQTASEVSRCFASAYSAATCENPISEDQARLEHD